MKHLVYHPRTSAKIAELSVCTPAMIREYLQLCLQISAHHTAHNVLGFPYDTTVNPYATFYHWLEQIDFRLTPDLVLTELERSQLQHFAETPTRDFRRHQLDSTQILFSYQGVGPQISLGNPYLEHFNQIMALNEILNCLHTYNFLLENYIHESHELRCLARRNIIDSTGTYLGRLHRTWSQNCPATREYHYWVRSFLLHEGIDHGTAPFSQYMSHNFGRRFQHHHPIINPANRTAAVEAYLANQKFATEFQGYRYYRFLQPTPEEDTFFHELRNDISDFVHNELLDAGLDTLQRAVDLAGHVNKALTLLSKQRRINHQ